MSLNSPRFFAIAALAAFTVGAVQPDDSCETKLVKDLYYSAFAANYKSGLFHLEDLEKAAASTEPFNPITNATPGSRNSAAIRLFANLIQNQEIRAQWGSTRKALSALLNREKGLTEVSVQAKETTAKILSPEEVLYLPKATDTLAFGTLRDGRVVVALIEDAKEAVVKTAAGVEIFRTKLPPILQMDPIRVLGWHNEAGGKVSLYLAGSKTDDRGTRKFYLYRLIWGEKKFAAIDYQPKDTIIPERFWNIGPRYMVLQGGGNALNVANGKPEPKRSRVIETPQAAVVTDDGKLVTRNERFSDDGTDIVFKRADGTVMHAVALDSIAVNGEFDRSMRRHLGLSANGKRIEQIAMGESRDGRLLLAADYFEDSSSRIFRVFEPYRANYEMPIAEVKLMGKRLPSRMHFFNYDNRLLLGLELERKLVIIDPDANSVIYQSTFTMAIDGWYTEEGETYVWTHREDGYHIYSLFSEGKP